MARTLKKKQRHLTDEERNRIEKEPGVIVHVRKEPAKGPFYVPGFRASAVLPITASDLIDFDLDEWSEQ